MPTILVVALLTIVCAAGIGFVIAANADEADQSITTASGRTVRLTEAQEQGRELFGSTCANCHTLAAVDAVGKIGPNLDEVRPDAALVRSVVRNGIESPLGSMPPGLLSGQEADEVADFVAVATQ